MSCMFKWMLILLFSMPFFLSAQPKSSARLKAILNSSGQPVLNSVMANPDKYRLQIIYTVINRDKKNQPHFHNYYFHYDPDLYFNPASMVKMPLAFLSLEKLNDLKIAGVNKYTSMRFDSSYPGQKALITDTTSANGLPSIAHFIKRAFLISENDPYNRFYQFVGQQQINRSLHAKGYKDARILRQFAGFTPDGNRHTNAIKFLDSTGKIIYSQPAAYNTYSFDLSKKILLGKAYLNRNDSLINQPFDFTGHNNLSLEDMQQMLQSVLFPFSVAEKQRFKISDDDHHFLLRYLSQFSSETSYPLYDTSLFYDSYVKFFFRDSTHKLPADVRVFNKVGWSYGFLTDVSYVADFKNNIEYMLAAILYVNSDDILNDNKYEYETIGHPFLYQLGQTIYHYELARKRKVVPDLSAFKIVYDHRDPNDKRIPLKEVDN